MGKFKKMLALKGKNRYICIALVGFKAMAVSSKRWRTGKNIGKVMAAICGRL